MIRLIKSLAANVATLGLALILAVLIWGVAVRESDPPDLVQFEVPVQELGRPEDRMISGIPSTVVIGVEGPSSTLSQLAQDDFSAIVDLAEAPPGESIVPIQVQYDQRIANLSWQVPEQVTINVERIVTRDIPVEIEVRGDVARGYAMGTPVADPEMITVSGLGSRVESLAEARVTIILEQPQQDVIRTRRPTFYDRQGNVVSTANLNPETEEVVITIPVEQLAGYAAKPIIVEWEGEPAQGYRLLDVNVEPDSVLVTGNPTQLDQLSRLRTELIDITGLRESQSFPVTLNLPDGIELNEVQPIVVEIEIEPILTTSILRKVPEIRAMGEGLTMTTELEEVRVFLYGPLDKLDSLVEEDIRVTLDLFGLDAGTHSLEPDADVFVNDIEVRSMQPPELTVTLTRTLTTTEEITASETATPLSHVPLPLQTTTSRAAPLTSAALAFIPAVAFPAGLVLSKRKDLL